MTGPDRGRSTRAVTARPGSERRAAADRGCATSSATRCGRGWSPAPSTGPGRACASGAGGRAGWRRCWCRCRPAGSRMSRGRTRAAEVVAVRRAVSGGSAGRPRRRPGAAVGYRPLIAPYGERDRHPLDQSRLDLELEGTDSAIRRAVNSSSSEGALVFQDEMLQGSEAVLEGVREAAGLTLGCRRSRGGARGGAAGGFDLGGAAGVWGGGGHGGRPADDGAAFKKAQDSTPRIISLANSCSETAGETRRCASAAISASSRSSG